MARVAVMLRRARGPLLALLAATTLGGIVLGPYLPALITWLACSACLCIGLLWMAWETTGRRE